VGRRGAVAFDGGGGLSVVADDTSLVLHHVERGRKVRWGPRKVRRGAPSGSPSGRTTAASQGKISEGSDDPSVRGWLPILGRMGEASTCLSAGEKARAERGNGMAVDAFLWWLGGAGGE
jgi:hypothetical protein